MQDDPQPVPGRNGLGAGKRVAGGGRMVGLSGHAVTEFLNGRNRVRESRPFGNGLIHPKAIPFYQNFIFCEITL